MCTVVASSQILMPQELGAGAPCARTSAAEEVVRVAISADNAVSEAARSGLLQAMYTCGFCLVRL